MDNIKINNLSNANATLHEELNQLREQMNRVERNILTYIKLEETPKKDQDHYETDDEELSRETEWILQGKKKDLHKRKASHTQESQPRTKAITSHESSVPNWHQKQQKKIEETAKVPPPINVTDFTDYNELHELVFSVIKDAIITLLNNWIFKINPRTDTAYKVSLTYYATMKENALRMKTSIPDQ